VSAFVITRVKFRDMEKYRSGWQAQAQAMHDKHGGKLLARTVHPDVLAGTQHDGTRVVIMEFQNTAKAREWWNDVKELVADKNVGDHHVMIVEGVHG
jgi:uncharacterized protein (DUF1330 family)